MKLRALFLSLLLAGSPLFADTIEGDVRDITGGTGLNTVVRFTPLTFPSGSGTYIIAGPARSIVPKSGKFTNDFAGGNYKVTVGSYNFYIAVPGDGGTYDLPTLATNGLTTYTYTNPIPYYVAAGDGISIATSGVTNTISTSGGSAANWSTNPPVSNVDMGAYDLTVGSVYVDYLYSAGGGAAIVTDNNLNVQSNLTVSGTIAGDGSGLTGLDIEDVHLQVRNVSGVQIDDGTPVYITGWNADSPTVEPADADDAAKMPAVGLMDGDLPNGQTGNAIMSGNLTGQDTSSPGYSVGDAVYVDTTAGALTSTKPTAADAAIQKVGIVTRVHASQGVITVFGAGRANDIPNRFTGVHTNVFDTDSIKFIMGNYAWFSSGLPAGESWGSYNESYVRFWDRHTGGIDDGLVIIGGGDVDLIPDGDTCSLQIGASGTSGSDHYMQYATTPDATYQIGFSHPLEFRARKWNGSAISGSTARPGFHSTAYAADDTEEGRMYFYSKAPTWNDGNHDFDNPATAGTEVFNYDQDRILVADGVELEGDVSGFVNTTSFRENGTNVVYLDIAVARGGLGSVPAALTTSTTAGPPYFQYLPGGSLGPMTLRWDDTDDGHVVFWNLPPNIKASNYRTTATVSMAAASGGDNITFITRIIYQEADGTLHSDFQTSAETYTEDAAELVDITLDTLTAAATPASPIGFKFGCQTLTNHCWISSIKVEYW